MFENYDFFLKIVEYKNISKAAEALYTSQPSLTKRLQRLEASVGAPLFDRTSSPLKLTAAGEAFLDYVQKNNTDKKSLQKRIHEIVFEGGDTITIGMALWRASILLPEFLPYFYQKYPYIQIQLREGSAAHLEQLILNDEIDLSIVNLPINHVDVSTEIILNEYIYLLGSKKNLLVKKISSNASAKIPTVDIHTFAGEPFILTQPGQHLTAFVNAMLSEQHLSLNCIMHTLNVSTAINLAASDIGFTFVPELGTMSRFFPGSEVQLFKVNTPPLRCPFAAVYKKTSYLSTASKLFISELCEFAAKFHRSV